MAAIVVLSNWSRPIKSTPGQLTGTNHTIVSRGRHCDGDVVIRPTDGHLVFIARLLSMSKIQVFLRAFLHSVLYHVYRRC